MQKDFIKIGDQIVHYRSAGNGLPLLLLHPSPNSSKLLLPLIQALSEHFLVVAPDIPGYGLSQPLVSDFQDIKDYAFFFSQFLEELGFNRIAIYGTATGAQIAIRFGLEFPQKTAHLFLDNAAHFTDEQSTKILETYFPNLQAQYDGSHLPKIWTFVNDLFLFFPWSWSKNENRIHAPHPPDAVLQMVAMDFLQAGGNYDRAYRAAFIHEKVKHVQALTVPTTYFQWKGSILKPYMDSLLEHPLPENINVFTTPADRIARQQIMVQQINKDYTNGDTHIALAFNNGLKEQGYIRLKEGDLHYYFHQNKTDEILLVLHDLRSSAAVALEEYLHLIRDKSILAISLPNHGDSDTFDIAFEIELIAALIKKSLDQLGIQQLSIFGFGWPKKVSDFLSEKYTSIQSVNLPITVKSPLPKLEIRANGAHLMDAWFYLRHRILFKNPNERTVENIQALVADLDPEMIHLELLEWLKCRI